MVCAASPPRWPSGRWSCIARSAKTPIALAHSLAGSSATVGFNDLSSHRPALEHAADALAGDRHGTTEEAGCSSTRPRRSAACCTSSPPASSSSPRRGCWRAWPSTRSNRRAARRPPPPRPTCRPSPARRVRRAARPRASSASTSTPECRRRRPRRALPASRPMPFSTSGCWHDRLRHADARRCPGRRRTRRRSPSCPRARGVAVRRWRSARSRSKATEDIDAVDAVDAELFPDLRGRRAGTAAAAGHALRDWAAAPARPAMRRPACARCTRSRAGAAGGAMRLGEMAHRLETRIEQLLAIRRWPRRRRAAAVARRRLTQVFELLRARDAQAHAGAPRWLPNRRPSRCRERDGRCRRPPPHRSRSSKKRWRRWPSCSPGPNPAAPCRQAAPTEPRGLRLVALRAGRCHRASWPTSRRARRRPPCACARRCSTAW